jgi:hypothetical protein
MDTSLIPPKQLLQAARSPQISLLARAAMTPMDSLEGYRTEQSQKQARPSRHPVHTAAQAQLMSLMLQMLSVSTGSSQAQDILRGV